MIIILYLSVENLGYTPTNPDAEYKFLYNTSIKSIKKSYEQLLLDIKNNINGFKIGSFNMSKKGELESKHNLIQSFSLGSAFGEFTDVGASLGRFSQRIYIKGNYNGYLLSIDEIGTRYTDEFTFDDSGFFETHIKSQSLGCWSKEWKNNIPKVDRLKFDLSLTCIENQDFNSLHKKAKNINIELGKSFIIYTDIKIYKNENIIEEIPITK